MKKKLAIASLFVSFCFSVSALANNGQYNKGNEQKGSLRGQLLSFDDVKAACLNPARFHNQAAPTNIQISCRELQHRWLPDLSGTMTMPTSRQITTSVYSDKYTVSPITVAVPSAEQVSACPQFVEVAESVETVRAVDCDDVIAFSGSASDFCSEAVSSLRAQNASAITSIATGRAISLCASSYDDRGQRDQRGQRGERDQRGQRDGGSGQH